MLALGLIACGENSDSGGGADGTAAASVAVATTPADGTLAAASPDWAAEGQRLRDSKREAASRAPSDTAMKTNMGDFAYQSEPFDVKGPGTYVLRFADLPEDFDPNIQYALNLPLDLIADFGMAENPPQLVGRDGQRVFELEVVINSVSPELYPGVTGWLY